MLEHVNPAMATVVSIGIILSVTAIGAAVIALIESQLSRRKHRRNWRQTQRWARLTGQESEQARRVVPKS